MEVQLLYVVCAILFFPIAGVLIGIALVEADVTAGVVWWPSVFGLPLLATIGAGWGLRRSGPTIVTMVLLSPLFTFIAGLIAFYVVYPPGTFQ